MTAIGTRRLRAALSGFVQRAEAGERFIITVGGRPVARLGPIEAAGPVTAPSLEELARLGLVEPPRNTASGGGSHGRRDDAGDRRPTPSWFPADVRVDRIVRQVRG
ncbi:MAG: type II toxin-antitoxin system prevent-host-death family antitoxin [Acidimicrobiia bacterium]|nr:type II toxin-antitoxin system prevent-host-death family antitoxin [Acidimicrobiia bacterium]